MTRFCNDLIIFLTLLGLRHPWWSPFTGVDSHVLELTIIIWENGREREEGEMTKERH